MIDDDEDKKPRPGDAGRAAGGREGSGHEPDDHDAGNADDIVAMVETGPREPSAKPMRWFIVGLCLVWACFQLWIAYTPMNSHVARAWHLAFAISLCFLVYPGFKEASPTRFARAIGRALPSYGGERGRKNYILVHDLIFGLVLTVLGLFVLAFLPGIMASDAGLTPVVLTGIVVVGSLLEATRRLVAVALRFHSGFSDAHAGPRTIRLRRLLCGYGPDVSNRDHVPIYDIILAFTGAATALFIWWDYNNLVYRQGLPTTLDMVLGAIMIVLLLEAARRALGPALPILGLIFLAYCFVGPWMPEFLRHRGIPLDFVINDMYLSTTGIFGVPLGVSTDFVFLFVLFGGLLDKAGAGQYFISVAYSLLGGFRGGPAKAAVLASGLTGMVSGSSIANTVTTGTFTIPLMKKVGLPAHKAGAIEVAASTNGQLMPPIMGAAAFIMAEILGIPYLDVVRAALIPALISYLALIYVVHLEARKLDLKAIPRSELPPVGATFIKGVHYLIPIFVLMFYLVVLKRSPVTSCLMAIESLMVIMILQRPILAWLGISLTRQREGALEASRIDVGATMKHAFAQGFVDVYDGMIAGSRNMIAVGVATAAAGIIVGVVTSTGLVGRFVTLIDIISFGNIYLMLLLTAITSIILGMGLPTTANYIVMATLTAPVIVHLGGDAGLVFPLIAAHLFVFYFGILADDTPPVGLAAYAAAAIAKSDPIKTGVQGFTYDMRTAILPFVFLFNTELLMISGVAADGSTIWLTDPVKIAWVALCALAAMFAFAAFLQGFFREALGWPMRLVLLTVALVMFRPAIVSDILPLLNREAVQAVGLAVFGGIYLLQAMTARRAAA